MEREIDLKHFLEIEQKYNLYEDTIDEIHYWIYSRFTIWVDFFVKAQLNLGEAHNNKKSGMFEKADIFLKLVKNSLVNPNRRKRNVDIMFISHPRRVLNEGIYECIYTDKLAKEFQNYAVYEQPHQWQHLEPLDKTNMILGDSTLLKKGLYLVLYKTVLKGKYEVLCKKIENKVSKPLAEMEKRYGFSLDKKQIISNIATQIIFYKASVKDVNWLLTRLHPKVVVEVVGYNPFCMLVNEICKRKKIPTIELQHGNMSEHMAYQYSVEEGIAQFPDKFFVFSDYWKKQIHVPIKSDNLIVTGYPYFEEKSKEAKIIQEYNDGKINILFISQGTIGEKLSRLACDLADLLDADKYRVLYKLHPGEYAIWESRYSYLKNKNIIVISGSEYSLYDYFNTCKIQVGVYSTALYEGLDFGLDTFIHEVEMAGHMQGLYEAGYVKFVKDADELYKKMQEKKQIDNKEESFWKKNALENMSKEIKNIISSRKRR